MRETVPFWWFVCDIENIPTKWSWDFHTAYMYQFKMQKYSSLSYIFNQMNVKNRKEHRINNRDKIDFVIWSSAF